MVFFFFNSLHFRLDELKIIDIDFVSIKDISLPSIAVLYQDMHGNRFLKCYNLDVKEKEFSQVIWPPISLEPTSKTILSVKSHYGGLLVFSIKSILYVMNTGSNAQRSLQLQKLMNFVS